MKAVKCTELKPGMVVAWDVKDESGHIILERGDVLKEYTITRLLFQGMKEIFVEEMSYGERVRNSQAFIEFRDNYESMLVQFYDVLNDLVAKNIPLDVERFTRMVYDVLGHVKDIPVFDLLHNMRQYDDVTCAHGMNVALICNVMATWFGWKPEEIQKATVCGLLHDVGKMMVPQELIQKPGKLMEGEYQLVQNHAMNGYHFLKERGADPEICQAALMHHERCDGSGYPLGLKGENISNYAKLVTIADVYDAMTSSRVYRGPLSPFKVVETFEKEGYQKYETEYLLPFLERVANTYIQNQVRLSNGDRGEIVMIQKDHLSRPLVKCGEQIIKLKEHPELEIVCIL